MDDGSAAILEGRVLLIAPTMKDAAAAVRVFEAAGIPPTICRDIAEVCAEIERGAAVAIVPDEAILGDKDERLAKLLKDQPPWSDFPLIVLTPSQQTTAAARGLESVGHMTLMRRPVELRLLISTVEAALRDRRRQYARREDFAELGRQAEALRENDRNKDEFLAMLAHELRNPLAAVQNAVTILKLSPEEASQTWAVGVVERQVKQLVRLIDDLLEVSRITSGKIRLRKEFVHAGSVIERAVESAMPQINQRAHALKISIEGGQDLLLHVDAARVEQIVVNLLTNAAKYTADGGNIWLTATRREDLAVIGIRDDGTGIPPEKLPEMFKLFSQGDRTLARSEGGLGIGLTIAKRLAEMHGGDVVARSEGADKGSEFTLSLPLAEGPEALRDDPVPSLAFAGEGIRILVVDDSVDTARGMVRLLELLGHEVQAAHTGEEAIERAREFAPAVILLDIGLPGMDGYQVASALRKDPVGRHAVIVAVSGYGQDEDRRRSRAAGFDHHLVKPVEFDALVSLIRRIT